MYNSLRKKRIRVRLTAWYLAVLACVLLLYTAASCGLLWWDLKHELDRHAIQDLETVEGLLHFSPQGTLSFDENYHNHPESKQILERLLEVIAPDGTVLLRNERLGSRELGGPTFRSEGVGGYSPRNVELADGTRIRLFSRRHSIGNRPIIMRVGYSQDAIRQSVKRSLFALLLALPFALAPAGFAAYALARNALRPVDEMTMQAERIMPSNLGDRIPVGPIDDELAHLARVFNQMLTRIDHAFDRMKQFTSDAAHELRTPLAAIRSVGEVGLQRDADTDTLRDVIGSMLEEVGRLTQLTDSLLIVSRADAGQIQLHAARFAAMDLAREAVMLLNVLAEENDQQLIVGGNETAHISGDRLWLRQALVNIIHNAIRYTPRLGEVHITVEATTDGGVAILVADSGPGISEQHRSRIFERFYRTDHSRAAHSGGAGLGLSIARWAVETSGGCLSLDDRAGPGCVFRLQFHAASATEVLVGPGY